MSVSPARIKIAAETASAAGGAELLRQAQGRLCDAGWVIGLGGPRPSNQCPAKATPRRSRPLKGQSNALANTHAETYQGTGLSLPTQSIGGSHCQTRPARAKRMPERDRAAVAVDMLSIVGQSEAARAGEHLRGERFIYFYAIELVEAPPDLG